MPDKNINTDDFNMKKIVSELCDPESYNKVFLSPKYHDIHMPSVDELKLAVDMLRSVIFPGYYLHSEVREDTLDYYIGATLDKCYSILAEQLKRGYCFACRADSVCNICEKSSIRAVQGLFSKLPYIRHMLSTDAEAAYEGDPAARSIGEAIFCYPSVRALTNHRIAP